MNTYVTPYDAYTLLICHMQEAENKFYDLYYLLPVGKQYTHP